MSNLGRSTFTFIILHFAFCVPSPHRNIGHIEEVTTYALLGVYVVKWIFSS